MMYGGGFSTGIKPTITVMGENQWPVPISLTYSIEAFIVPYTDFSPTKEDFWDSLPPTKYEEARPILTKDNNFLPNGIYSDNNGKIQAFNLYNKTVSGLSYPPSVSNQIPINEIIDIKRDSNDQLIAEAQTYIMVPSGATTDPVGGKITVKGSLDYYFREYKILLEFNGTSIDYSYLFNWFTQYSASGSSGRSFFGRPVMDKLYTFNFIQNAVPQQIVAIPVRYFFSYDEASWKDLIYAGVICDAYIIFKTNLCLPNGPITV